MAYKPIQSKPQRLQYLIKLYCEEFFPTYNPVDYYKVWKMENGIKSANDISEDELNSHIDEFSLSLREKTP